MNGVFSRIWQIVRQVPRGRVTTYGAVALLAGNPRWARVVGYALHIAPGDVPCHRVVNRKGELSEAFVPEGKQTHRSLLEGEGVPFREDGTVLLEEVFWQGE